MQLKCFNLRAIAELQNNESQKALDDVKLSLRLTRFHSHRAIL